MISKFLLVVFLLVLLKQIPFILDRLLHKFLWSHNFFYHWAFFSAKYHKGFFRFKVSPYCLSIHCIRLLSKKTFIWSSSMLNIFIKLVHWRYPKSVGCERFYLQNFCHWICKYPFRSSTIYVGFVFLHHFQSIWECFPWPVF